MSVLLGLAALAACENPHAWYRVDDFRAVTTRPILSLEEATIAFPDSGGSGAPPRMVKFNDELQVQCIFCHVDGDPRTAELTPEGTESRLMMDLADRFKVECSFCHAQSPTQYTRAGKYAYRDMRIPERRWKCASCHDLGFRVTRRG